MPIWLYIVAIASIAVTAGLTWLLWRINLTMLREAETNPAPAAPMDDDDD